MKVFAIIGHQKKGSFCHAIAQAAVEELRAEGARWAVADLRDPVVREALQLD